MKHVDYCSSDRCDYSRETCVLLELTAVLLLVYRPAAVR